MKREREMKHLNETSWTRSLPKRDTTPIFVGMTALLLVMALVLGFVV